MSLAHRLKDRNEELKREKLTWKEHWQELSEFIMPRKSNINQKHQPGEQLNNEIFDSTAIKSNRSMASALIGMLWPSGSKSFKLTPPKQLNQTKEIKEYYESVTGKMSETMDDSRSGLSTSLDEYMLDQGCFGTSGIAIFPSDDDAGTHVTYQPWNIREMSIDEGPNGQVNTVFYEFDSTVRKVIEKYGIENVSEQIRDKAKNNGGEEPVKILQAIFPRGSMSELLESNDGNSMPYASIHLEIETSKILRRGGFDELPVKVGRFRKGSGEKYGRSPGIDALPDIRELNFVWQALTEAIEKQLDPPLALLDDGKLGGGVIDTSAGALNVLKISGRAGGGNPIIPLQTVGELNSTAELQQQLRESITGHFFIDRLLDFNNETQMTLGEAQIRNQLRNDALRAVFSRQISEIFVPLIERTFNILLKRNVLGVIAGSPIHEELLEQGEDPIIIPEEVAELMVEGRDVFDITFISPSQRLVQAREAEGIIRTWEFAGQVAAIQPEILDNLNADSSIRNLSEIFGAPSEILQSDETVNQIRVARNQQLQEQAQLEQAKEGSEIAKNVSQAEGA